MTTDVYIDGFNLYYGLLKKNPDLKWLDPVSPSYMSGRMSTRGRPPRQPRPRPPQMTSVGP
ncbi:hypothetical protein GCM10009535_04620 [Streptomyces thermocarboxydovorans]|uniref:NYN domain-containing protein n=1 Tax=Streptomyces thermocarboxydovorans TaxID=59298 RepID=A0ABN1H7S6_9ACTN